MNPWKRARLYLCRKKKRTVRLGLLFLVLAVFLSLCGWVQDSMAQNVMQLRKTIGASFRILDDENGARINDELIQQVESVGNIRCASGENLQFLYSESIVPVPGNDMSGSEQDKYIMSYYSGHYSALEQHFSSGEFVLAQGRHIEPADEWAAVISSALAERNGLSVGDTFVTGYAPDMIAEYPALADKQFTFTVTGIFDIAEAGDGISQATPGKPENAVFIDAAAGHAVDTGDQTHKGYRYGAVFQVDDPGLLEETVQQAEQLLDMAHFTLTTDDGAYQQSVQPMERMERIMGILVWVLSAAGVLVLALVLLLWVRQRTHEIGIFLSIGLSKRNILLQFMAESISLALAAWIVSVPVSCGITLAIQSRSADLLGLPPATALLASFVIELGVAALATLLASLYLLRLYPRDILQQQS